MSIVKLLGAPYDAGCRQETAIAIDQKNGPKAIRQAVSRMTKGLNVSIDYDDLADIQCDNTVALLLKAVEEQVLKISLQGDIPFVIGGAHTFTLGTLRALHKSKQRFSLIYIDAHPDIMPHAEINYGSVLYYAIKEKILAPSQIGLIGIRSIELDEAQFIEKENIFNIPSLAMEALGAVAALEQIKKNLPPPYFISIDLDSLDPSIAPGVTAPYPGGLSYRELLFITTELCKCKLIGIDIVELSPINDRDNQTANLAATLLLSLSTAINKAHQKI